MNNTTISKNLHQNTRLGECKTHAPPFLERKSSSVDEAGKSIWWVWQAEWCCITFLWVQCAYRVVSNVKSYSGGWRGWNWVPNQARIHVLLWYCVLGGVGDSRFVVGLCVGVGGGFMFYCGTVCWVGWGLDFERCKGLLNLMIFEVQSFAFPGGFFAFLSVFCLWGDWCNFWPVCTDLCRSRVYISDRWSSWPLLATTWSISFHQKGADQHYDLWIGHKGNCITW